jgi:hypothetical protein
MITFIQKIIYEHQNGAWVWQLYEAHGGWHNRIHAEMWL